ncbi:tetratricopeptide repeat protein [candidate division KSB1 bacterium]|nr:tetratricopeptide repeat protein [candidate division KSB1 bacterium]
MSRNQKTLLLIASFVVIWLGAYFMLQKPQAGRAIPDLSNRTGSGSASAEFLNTKHAFEYYRDEIRKKPETVKNYVQLAQLFMQEARITGRHHEYIPKVQSLLSEALARAPKDLEALITKASLLMTLHKFEDAKALVEQAVARAPYHAMAYGVLADALVELGDYEQAVVMCDKMLSVRPDLRSYSRAAYLRELHGDLEGAQQVMKLACDAGVSGHENRAWTLYQLGKLYFAEGRLDTATFIFNGILAERPDYAYAQSGLAQINLARKNYAEAIATLKQLYRDTPDHAFLEQLVEACHLAGETAEAEKMTKLALEAYAQHEQDGWEVNLEYARFCTSYDLNLPEALQRAQREYERRPNNIDVLEVYASALYKNGQPEKAEPFIKQALRLQTPRASLYFHAGMIAYQLGKHDEAQAHLQQALSMGPGFSAREAQIARDTLAGLRSAQAS